MKPAVVCQTPSGCMACGGTIEVAVHSVENKNNSGYFIYANIRNSVSCLKPSAILLCHAMPVC